jgi:hypothetical protein
MHHLDSRHEVEHLAGEMRIGADARGREVELPGLRFGERDELLDRFHRQRRRDDDDVRRHRRQRHGRKVPFGIVRKPRVNERVDRVAHESQAQRVTVRIGLGDDSAAYDAARAGAVVNHHLLAQAVGELLRDGAGDDVGGAPGGERHDDPDRAIRVLCCAREARY